MAGFRKVSGEIVDAGSYWNFESGEKVVLSERGPLPGKPSQSFFSAPPFIIMSAGAAAAFVFLYLLPKYLAPLYEGHTASLVRAYVILDFIAIGILMLGILFEGGRDMVRHFGNTPSFDWSPSRSYFDGNTSKDDRSGKKDNSKKTD